MVGSGNLEVLVEPTALGGACRIEILTAAVGFGPIWQAVLADFAARHPLADVRISINDAGATPAVVSLRLDQAMEAFTGAPAMTTPAQLLRGQCPRAPPRPARRRQLS